MTDKNSMKSSAKREFGDFVKRDLVGADEWRQSKIGYITGVGGIVRGGTTALRGTGGRMRWIGGMFKGLFSREKVLRLPTDSGDPAERFRIAQEAYGRSDQDVEDMTVRSGRQAWLYVMIAAALFVWAVYRASQGNNGLYGPVFPFLPLLFVLPFMIRSAFWNWQLRTRRLGSVREFVRMPGEWLPALRGLPAKLVLILGAGVSILSILMPGAAFAELPTDGLPDFLQNGAQSGSDIFMRTLGVIAGGVGPVPELIGEPSPWVAPLGNAFAAFNGALLAISGAMLGWHTLAGMVSTAHEGKVLGQRWHQIWAPIRVTLGVGTLVPVAGGFAAVQIIVLQIAVWGSALGNVVWQGYVQTWDDTAYLAGVDTELGKEEYKEAIYRLSSDTSANQFVYNLFRQSVCLAGLKEAVDIHVASYQTEGGTLPEEGLLAVPSEQLPRIIPNELDGAMMSYKDPAGSAGNNLSLSEIISHRVNGEVGLQIAGGLVQAPSSRWADLIDRNGFGATPQVVWFAGKICGMSKLNLVEIGGVKEYLDSLENSDRLDQAYAVIQASGERLAASIDQQVMRPISEAAKHFVKATRDAVDQDDPEAAKLEAYSRDGMVAKTLAQAYLNYNAIIASEMRNIDNGIYSLVDRDSFSALIDRASELGWSSAGAFYVAIGQMVEHDLSLGQITIQTTTPQLAYWQNEGILFNKVRDDIHDIFHHPTTGLQGALAQFKNTGWDAQKPDQANEDLIEDFQWEALDVSWWEYVHVFLNKIVRETLEPILYALEPDPFNAMVHMVAFGQAIIGAAAALAIAMAVLWGTSLGAKLFGESIDNWPLIGSLVGGGSKLLAEVGFVLVSVLKIFTIIILAVGLVHAYLIPMLPYIFMLFFVTGMLILIAEGLVAAPIWAFMHVRMDGQEFVDQVQKPGYMIAFNLLLRPALAVFGLILSMVIFSASIFFMNETFHIAAQMAMPDAQGISLVGILSMLILQVYLHYQIAIRSFQLIVQVPDRVTRWFGQGGENLNEDQDSAKVVGALVGNSEGRIDKASGMAAAGKQQRLEQEAKEAATGGGKEGAEKGKDGKESGGAQKKDDPAPVSKN